MIIQYPILSHYLHRCWLLPRSWISHLPVVYMVHVNAIYTECSLISYQKIQIRGGGECFVKLNHKFNPAEKYGVQQYWFKDCNKGYHGLAAQICSSGHKDSGNWKNANRKLSPSHITLGLPSPLPQACVLNQFIMIYFECLNLEMSPTQIMSCNFFRILRCKMFGLVKQLNKE